MTRVESKMHGEGEANSKGVCKRARSRWDRAGEGVCVGRCVTASEAGEA